MIAALRDLFWWIIDGMWYLVISTVHTLFDTFFGEMTWLPQVDLSSLWGYVEIANYWLPLDYLVSLVPLYLSFEASLLFLKIAKGAIWRG